MGLAGYGGDYMGGSPSLGLMEREKPIDDAQRSKRDPSLRGVEEVIGYHIHATDGDIGHVDDLLVEITIGAFITS